MKDLKSTEYENIIIDAFKDVPIEQIDMDKLQSIYEITKLNLDLITMNENIASVRDIKRMFLSTVNWAENILESNKTNKDV